MAAQSGIFSFYPAEVVGFHVPPEVMRHVEDSAATLTLKHVPNPTIAVLRELVPGWYDPQASKWWMPYGYVTTFIELVKTDPRLRHFGPSEIDLQRLESDISTLDFAAGMLPGDYRVLGLNPPMQNDKGEVVSRYAPSPELIMAAYVIKRKQLMAAGGTGEHLAHLERALTRLAGWRLVKTS